MNYTDLYSKELAYIDSFWDKATIRPRRREKILNIILRKATKRMHENVLNLPKSFIIPNTIGKRSADSPGWSAHIFYWDTFFMFRGLMRTKRDWIMRSMVDNFLYLYERYGIIPNFNSPASTGRSQPPLLTSMILDVYEGYIAAAAGKNPFKKLLHDWDYYDEWLSHAANVAKQEYWNVWMDIDGYFHHKVAGFDLSRYGDRDIGYAHSAELESGWDFTSRFYNRCNEFLPIDLNIFLYKYEHDFAKIARYLADAEEEKFWQKRSTTRLENINKLMWNYEKGFFFDYGYKYDRQSDFLSLAGFTPMWAGAATEAQAAKMVENLKYFETDSGLTITAHVSLAPKISLFKIPERYRAAIREVLSPKQWDYPNIWPPLEYLAVIGLLQYGYKKEAVQIMKNSLAAQSKIFKKYGTFFEKINGLTSDISSNYHYTQQQGFGWTNAIFYRYVKILEAIDAGINIYESDPSGPPFKLVIPH